MKAKRVNAILALFLLTSFQLLSAQNKPLVKEIKSTMLKATRFMVEEVSYNGGYVWNYTPDRSRCWGEMEAKPTMIWTQAPGTPSMGQLFLDAYHATGNEYYYQAAEKAAQALIKGQLDSGGWNYMIDFAGEESLIDWYNTIGKNGWRLEEFQHYYGNATFDDEATFGPAYFLLRMYQEKNDAQFKIPLQKAILFVLESQYPIGGWPQRFPLNNDYQKDNHPDYSSFITLNDDVHRNNVLFLVSCFELLGDSSLLEPIQRAMNCIMILQQDAPQPGWSWQFTTDLKPTGARTYEPAGIYSGATYSCIGLLMDYYELTGETKFLTRIPEALQFLESIKLPEEFKEYYPREILPGFDLYPSCVEVGTNKPLYVHRSGSNATSGKYFADYNHLNQWMPTFSMRSLNLQRLKDRFAHLKMLSPEKASENSPLKTTERKKLPKFVSGTIHPVIEQDAQQIINDLRIKPYWEGTFAYSNPYIGDGPVQPTEGDFSCTQNGDKYDTSPFRFSEDTKGISTSTYIENMFRLICYLNQ
jgi:PelA/Pel-15E family pectate lyase